MPDTATGSAPTSTLAERPGSLQEAQHALEKLMAQGSDFSDSATPTPSAPKKVPKATGDAGAEDPPLEEEVAPEEEAAAEEEEPETTEEDEQPPETLYTVTIDGKEEQVRASELIAGYQRNQSYTRKSMALAEERKAFAQTQQAISAEREEYAALIPQLRKALEVQEPDWAKIKAEQPEQYPTLLADWTLHLKKLDGIAVEEKRVNALRQQEFNAKREQLITNERNAFIQAEPSWKDPKVAAKDAKDVMAVLQSVGFEGDDLNIYDHRSLRLALMAAKFMRGVTAKGAIVRQRAESAPTIVSGAGPVKKVARGSAEAKAFAKSGSPRDAAAMWAASGMFD